MIVELHDKKIVLKDNTTTIIDIISYTTEYTCKGSFDFITIKVAGKNIMNLGSTSLYVIDKRIV